MKPLPKPIFLFLPLLALVALHPFQTRVSGQQTASLTPTYDPLVEPPLPDHPTELELGQNLYWHWCMTCHGDHGQGLTDEFRGIWEPEHQNCWGRGCHAGRPGDEGFPIPTVVPALVNETQRARFASIQQLADFLKATHPPQSPGVLTDDEYYSIALFVFTMNGRPLVSTSITETPTSVPTLTSAQTATPSSFVGSALIFFVVLIIGVLVWTSKTYMRK